MKETYCFAIKKLLVVEIHYKVEVRQEVVPDNELTDSGYTHCEGSSSIIRNRSSFDSSEVE